MMTLSLVSRSSLLVAAAAVCSAAAPLVPAEELPTKKALSLEVARQVAAAAEKHARENKWNVCIAVVDDGGHLVYFQRMDGTQTGSVVVSQRKAQTAISFKRPTKVFEEGVAGGRTAPSSRWKRRAAAACASTGRTRRSPGLPSSARVCWSASPSRRSCPISTGLPSSRHGS